MQALEQDKLNTQQIQHLGLVADVIERLGIVKYIDEQIPISQQKGAKVSMGKRVAAMILNGLGFISTPLYMFPAFLQDKAVERLLAEGLKAEDFNDDATGRCLDAIADFGIEKLFARLAFKVILNARLWGKSVHLDTTSLSLYGQYAHAQDDENLPIPKYGYSKDHRPDLKQMILTLATTGPAALPIWMQSHSGNASDQNTLQATAKRIETFRKELQQAPPVTYVAVSAMYNSCLNKANAFRWLARVPETNKEARAIIQQEDDAFTWHALPNGYRYSMLESKYKGVPQRWCLVFSQQAYEREVSTLEKKIAKEYEAGCKKLWHLSCQKFACPQDASKALQALVKGLKYHQLVEHITPILGYATPGRPSKASPQVVQGYRISGELVAHQEAISLAKRRKGRFILATNDLARTRLADAELLTLYKEQQTTERGFRFIKNNRLHLSSVYLKTPSRISALMMLMVLCLMVYNYAQYALRMSLSRAEATIPNQLNKPTKRPTMQYVFFLFRNVQLLHARLGGSVAELVLNLSGLLRQIVSYFGIRAQTIYGLV
jgi:transposase